MFKVLITISITTLSLCPFVAAAVHPEPELASAVIGKAALEHVKCNTLLVNAKEQVHYDRSIENKLRSLEIIDVQAFTQAKTSWAYLVTLSDGTQGIFKTDHGTTDNYHHEVLVYEVAKKLGIDYVPPTVYRTIEVEGIIPGIYTGSLQLYIPEALTVYDLNKFMIPYDFIERIPFQRRFKIMNIPEEIRFLDLLTVNVDRTFFNMIHRLYAPSGFNEIYTQTFAIDHARSFNKNARKEKLSELEHELTIIPEWIESLQDISDQSWEKLFSEHECLDRLGIFFRQKKRVFELYNLQ